MKVEEQKRLAGMHEENKGLLSVLLLLASFWVISISAQTKLDQDIARAATNVFATEQNAVANTVFKITNELGALEQNDGGSSFYLMTLAKDPNQIYALSLEFTVFGTEKGAMQGLKDELRHFASDTAQLRKLYNFELPSVAEHRNVFLIVWNGSICAMRLDRLNRVAAKDQALYLNKFESIKTALLAAAPGAFWVEIDNAGTCHWNNPTLKYSVN